MTNLSQPEITNLLGKLRDMERRIMDLERGNALTGALPQGQSISVLDPTDGSQLVIMGQHSGNKIGAIFYDASGQVVGILGQLPNGNDGAQFSSTGVTALRVGPDGVDRPGQHVQVWSVPYARVNVTSGSFTAAWRADAFSSQHRVVRTSLLVGADVGTSGELRISAPFTAEFSSVYSITGAGTTAGKRYDLQLSGSPGGSVAVEVELRRTAGAGNVYVEKPIVSFGESSNTGVWI